MINFHGGDAAQSLLRAGLLPGQVIDFSASINPLGPPRGVLSYFSNLMARDIALYPTNADRASLTELLAEQNGLNPSSIMLTNGSSEAIYLISSCLRLKRAGIVSPNFSEYERALLAFGRRPKHVFLKEEEGFALPSARLKVALKSIGAIFLSNPNNPTGRLYDKAELLDLIYRAKDLSVMVLVDESFIDFVFDKKENSLIDHVGKTENLIVISSLTKFYSLAGLRIGYIAGSKSLIDEVAKVAPPWNLSTPTLKSARIALLDEAFKRASLKTNIALRSELKEGLSSTLKIKTFTSKANFILFKLETAAISSSDFFVRLLKSGFHIRDCSSFKGLGHGFFRVSVQSRRENLKLIEEINRLMEGL